MADEKVEGFKYRMNTRELETESFMFFMEVVAKMISNKVPINVDYAHQGEWYRVKPMVSDFEPEFLITLRTVFEERRMRLET